MVTQHLIKAFSGIITCLCNWLCSKLRACVAACYFHIRRPQALHFSYIKIKGNVKFWKEDSDPLISFSYCLPILAWLMGWWGKKMQQHMKNVLHPLDLLLGLLSVEQSLGTAFPLQSVMYYHWSQADSALRRASVVVRAARAVLGCCFMSLEPSAHS